MIQEAESQGGPFLTRPRMYAIVQAVPEKKQHPYCSPFLLIHPRPCSFFPTFPFSFRKSVLKHLIHCYAYINMCAHISIHTYCVYIYVCVCIYIYKYCIYIKFSLLHLVHKSFSGKFHKNLIFKSMSVSSGLSVYVFVSFPNTRTVPDTDCQGLENQFLRRSGWQVASREQSMWGRWVSWMLRLQRWCWIWTLGAASDGAGRGVVGGPASERRCSDWILSPDHCHSAGWAVDWTGHRQERPGPSTGLES